MPKKTEERETIPIESYKVCGCPKCNQKPVLEKNWGLYIIGCPKHKKYNVSTNKEIRAVQLWNDQTINPPTYELKSIAGILGK